MTPFLALYSTSICGSGVSSRPPLFLLSAGVAIVVLVTAHETTPAWYSSLGSSPAGTPLIRVCASRRTPFCVVLRLSRVAQALSAWSWVFMCSRVCFFCISYIGLLQSWPYASVAEFDVINVALAFPGPTFVEPTPQAYL